nr:MULTISPECIES: diguanylate cyclase [unclassified Actinomyces]
MSVETQVGYERFFDPEDIFFSTTDRRGVITRSNRTFDTLSRYHRDRLIGAPHNIIRHLDMPAGVFRLMWDDLEAGRPACAYVRNRAADGLDYCVFATIVPVSNGYLSVRTKPLDTTTLETVSTVYRTVRAKERAEAAQGASRRRVGEVGAAALTAELNGLGFDSLYAMTLQQLPREVSALVSAGVRVPGPMGVDGPVTRILEAAGHLERETNLLVFELEEYLRLLTSMSGTRSGLLDVADRADAFGRVVGGRRLNIADRADALASQVIELSQTVAPRLRSLPEGMDALRTAVLELRYSVALIRLHTLMVGRFARSVLDGSEESPADSIAALCEALESGFARLGPVCREVEEGVVALDGEIRQVTPLLDRMVRRLSRWVDRRGGRSTVTAEAADLVEHGTPEVKDLAALAAECRGLHLPYHEDAVNQRLAVLRQAVGQL